MGFVGSGSPSVVRQRVCCSNTSLLSFPPFVKISTCKPTRFSRLQPNTVNVMAPPPHYPSPAAPVIFSTSRGDSFAAIAAVSNSPALSTELPSQAAFGTLSAHTVARSSTLVAFLPLWAVASISTNFGLKCSRDDVGSSPAIFLIA